MDGWMQGAIEVSAVEYWAALGRLNEVIEAVRTEPDVNARSQGGHTALHAAAENGYLEVVRFLVENGADCSLKVDSGETALDLALMAGHTEVAEYLKNCQPG